VGDIGFANVTGIAFGPGVTIIQSGGSTTVTEGGATDSYTVVLDTPPTANVTITINPGTQVTVVPASLTFTPANWNTAQTVTVTAVDDALAEGPHTGTITHTAASADAAYNSIVIAAVTANIADNDSGLPLPPGLPKDGGLEGSFSGSNGNSGPEGGFGFGGRALLTTNPVLWGPVADALSPMNLRVYNVSHHGRTRRVSSSGHPTASDELSAWFLSVGAVLGLGLPLIQAGQR